VTLTGNPILEIGKQSNKIKQMSQHHKIFGFIISVITLLIFPNLILLAAEHESALDSCKILFIGNSYFKYNNLPNLFKNISDSLGQPVLLGQQIVGGTNLSYHADNDLTEQKINETSWDYVVLMPTPTTTAYPTVFTKQPVYPPLITLKRKIHENCESTRIILCMPWAFEDGMIWLSGWTDEYPEMQAKIYNNTIQIADSLNLIIAPVGWAWNAVLEERDYPLHYLHLSDWSHPSMSGSYLMACVVYSTIFRENTENCKYVSILLLDESAYFQTIASNTVLNDLDLWNNSLITTGTEFCPLPNRITLFQNYPNPFNVSTRISFELSEPALVNLNIFDLNGKLVKTLISHTVITGLVSTEWDATAYTSGIYFIQLISGNNTVERKLLLIK